MRRTVGVIGTLDTKGAELKFIKDQIEARGVETLVIDVSVIGKPAFTPGISASEIARAAGADLNELIKERDRGRSIATMGKGAAVIVKDLYGSGKIHGVISIGGSAGTTIGTQAMRALPTGVPKIMVTTAAPAHWCGPDLQE